ncbi:hypothetical protein DXT96_06865 [Agrobacterium sp. ICMP 6402]|uniref:hypothetical protein n=1 Tax=Agrobacterium sp. ICMP 6402 TaxID=2292443 RepID=UPI001297D79A|nr:hypothetical protein [Agrobacterium sp. ICMP 6402]MQB09576.1 hypothetical protein [Agrobacterium sp. ICMP 6402]
MQSETAISRELMGKIVDEVFDGAIEDASVIEDIYAVIKREESTQSKIDERKPLDLTITQDWFEKRAALEADHEIGAGPRKFMTCVDPTPDELAELFKIAHRIPDGWQLVPVAALSAAEPVAWRYSFKGGKWTVQKNKPHWFKEGMPDVEIEPLFISSSTQQPAPSVAVKAIFEKLDSVIGFEEQDRETIAEIRTMVSALSAQVQDVTGNADDYYGSDPAELKRLLAQRDKWIVDNDHWHDFTRSLPAVPAKQEDGHD